MALSADRNLEYFTSQQFIEVPVDDNEVIYKGAFVGRNRSTGYARALTAGDEFLGIAYQQADNTIGGHTAGGINVRLFQAIDIVHTLTSVANADIGKDVYASADDTLTLTPIGNSRVGRIISVEATNSARIRVQPVTHLDGALDNHPILTLADDSATLTLDHMNRVLLVPNTGAVTLTLPAAATVRAGAWFRVIKTTSDAAAITLDGNASETIDGATTLATIDAQYDCALLLCTGSEWVVLSRDIT